MASVLGGQFNLHRGITGTTALGCFLRKHFQGQRGDYDSFVIGLQEPAVARGNKVIGLDPSVNLLYDRSATRVRAALCASPLLNIWPVATLMDGDVATGLWKTGDESIPEVYLVSAYFDIQDARVCPKTLEKLLRTTARNGVPVNHYGRCKCPQHHVGLHR